MCGRAAVNLAKQGKGGVMVSLKRAACGEYKCETGTVPLEQVAVKAKPMPDEYISVEGNFITPAFLDYLRPLVGELPQYTTLKMNRF
jgi:6-phosphofructokinase 1